MICLLVAVFSLPAAPAAPSYLLLEAPAAELALAYLEPAQRPGDYLIGPAAAQPPALALQPVAHVARPVATVVAARPLSRAARAIGSRRPLRRVAGATARLRPFRRLCGRLGRCR